ncbi:Low-density lipoprotein receptor-related protein 2 [Camelus dromedarius]|uniref:Low-density lipoprotein receptor-related protein 2 n=1 Tax=Camelus dromedarius TaxID=9838 RepID=A0A5N4CF39_CAMDR|nr:Low-density lipoprotein receptor-related protein 2 [Camelus dromedarius]
MPSVWGYQAPAFQSEVSGPATNASSQSLLEYRAPPQTCRTRVCVFRRFPGVLWAQQKFKKPLVRPLDHLYLKLQCDTSPALAERRLSHCRSARSLGTPGQSTSAGSRMRGAATPSAAPLHPGGSSPGSGSANSPPTAPRPRRHSPCAAREREKAAPAPAPPAAPRAARLPPGSPRCLLAAMGRRELPLLLPTLLAVLGGLEGSVADEIQCNVTRQAACGGGCIPVAWLCNGEQECLDGTDEQCEEICRGHPQAWQCDDGKCISISWLCDGVGDCLDGSDEVNCERLTARPDQKIQCPGDSLCRDAWELCDANKGCEGRLDEARGPRTGCMAGQWQCRNGLCITHRWRCDGLNHCGDSSDEEVCDVDECSTAYSPCGQLCINTPGSYSCECIRGYQLYNGTDCRVTDDAVKILTAADGELGVLDQRTGIFETLIPIKSRPTSVAYDLERSMYFWVDEVLNVFVLGKPNFVPLYPEFKAVNSISLDWFTGQLYWASSFARVVCAGLSDGRGYVKILEKDLVPEQLIVFPAKKYLYWVNRGGKGMRTIETAGMDGSDRKVLTVVNMEEPAGLTLDHVTGRLYWISEYKESIETVNVDGSGRHTFPEIFLEDEVPVGLAVFENSFFWANKLQLLRISPHTPKERVALLNTSVSAFSVLHKSQQPKSRYPACVPGSCSHLCLLSPVHPKGYKCVCPEGMFLLPSGTCSSKINLSFSLIELKLVFSSGKRLYLLKVGFMGTSIERTVIQEHPRNIYLLDIDWKRNLIYWTDTRGHLFHSTGYSGEKQEIRTEHTVCSASVDIPTGNLYWLPCDRSAVQKTRITGPDTRTLYRTGSVILHLLLDWPKRLLYWMESGEHLQSMTLDGKGRQEIWRGTWTADTHVALDLGSSSILWATKGSEFDSALGLQSLSLLKNRTYTLNKTWSDGMIAAHEPYLVTLNRTALVLWNRRMPEPFLVLKEPYIQRMIILAENLEVPDPEVEGATTSTPRPPPPPPPLLCTRSSVPCRNGQECISRENLCDGKRDCEDGSDEENCSQFCNRPGVFQCLDGNKCIEEKYHCDGAQQCLDGSDELDCWKPVEDCSLRCDKTRFYEKCSTSEFKCQNGQCVSSSLRCDGNRDCLDHSDEEGCPAWPLTCLSGEVKCPRSGECVLAEWICDHDLDCKDGTDEKVCACEQGFELKSSGQICEDVDECRKLGGQPCSQTCINTQGSYSCTCHPGYLLEPDGHTCKATGTEPVLLVAIQFKLLLYGLRSLKEDILATTDKNLIIFSIDYDLVDQKVFWTDLGAESIQWISMDTKRKGTVVKGIKSDCIAVDWIGRNLYWTDKAAGQILAIQLTAVWRGKSEYTIVLDANLNQPRSLALDPLNGMGEQKLILLYFRCYDDMLQLTQVKSPFSVAVFEDEVFWSEMKTRTVQRMKKATGKKRAVLIKRFEQPYGLKVIHQVLQPRSSNPCLDTRCSHLCLLSPRSKGSCRCPVGLLLADDGVNCVPLKESAFLFLMLPTVIMQIYLRNLEAFREQATFPEHRILPFTSVSQLASMDYLVQEKMLYLSEWNKGDIWLWRLKESGKLSWRKIISVEGTVIDLAVDCLSGNIYWIDSENPHINVASSKGQYSMVLFSDSLYRPASVVLHPPTATLCFVDLGSQDDGRRGSSIECASMDGSRRKVLWQKSQVPVGLTFSDAGTRVYWADPGRGLIESIQPDGSRYRVDRRGIQGLNLFTYGQGMMFWTTVDDAQINKVWYSNTELSENRWFQVDQKIMDLKVYSKLGQQGDTIVVVTVVQKTMEDAAISVYQTLKDRLVNVPVGTTWLTDINVLKLSNALRHHNPVRMVRSAFPWSKFVMVKLTVWMDLMKWTFLIDSDKLVYMPTLIPTVFVGTYPDKTHLTPKMSGAGEGLTPKAAQPVQGTKFTRARSPGPEGMNHPARKTLIPLIPTQESKTPETKGGGESVQLKDSQKAKHLPCSSDFCNGRGACTMEGELRKCSCLMEYGGEFCEEAARRPTPGYMALSLTIALLVVLVVLGAFVYFRRDHELKRNSRASSRNLTRHKENNQEEENLMNSEIFVNEAYDEQELLTSLQTD